MTTIGIDLGATHVRAGLVDQAGRLSRVVRRVLPPDPAARVRTTRQVLAEYADVAVAAVGVAVAGTVRDGVLTWSANLGLSGVDFAAELGRPVTVLNDARAAGLAEARLGAGAGAATVLVVTVGTGLGGALVTGGRLHEGTGHAGEVGHLVLDADGPPCGCGNRGCWEQLAGGVALNRTGAALAPTGAAQPGAARLAAAVTAGQPRATAALERHAAQFARGLDSLCAVLAPHTVVLGGGLIARPGPIRDAYLAAAGTLRWHSGPVHPARLGDDAGVLGAALAANPS
ncbi:ROK family protein [Goodfellowiella coeruleoviolacea]|uniref:Glucokinase n=1 Tax=Goodfellowiella coeruleoviolacea TaxID=334858 RepID=A0AAE3GA37_9PSEU|nr:ROK family protein [Goodfellowiella coeruleoviolacea]MCP2163184.1 glucokinase [Goodfellowiella coeruleoviolacea]